MFVLVLAIASASFPSTIGADANCALALNDDTSLLQVKVEVDSAPQTSSKQKGAPAVARGLPQSSSVEGGRSLPRSESQKLSPTSLTASVVSNARTVTSVLSKVHTQGTMAMMQNVLPLMTISFENAILLLDHCPEHPQFVTLIAVIVSVSVQALSTLMVFFILPSGSDGDLRKKFHSARLAPWICLGILGSTTIPITMHRLLVEDVAWRDTVSNCVPTLPCFAVTLFATLLLTDLVWIVGVFRSWRQKPLLLLHHTGYILWCSLTLFRKVGYMNLVTMVIGFEESPEIFASISYLKKDGKHGHWYLLFTVAFRMVSCGYAVGCTMLFIALGDAQWELKAFLWFDVGLWIAFACQEWTCLVSMAPGTRKAMSNNDDTIESKGNHRVFEDIATPAKHEVSA